MQVPVFINCRDRVTDLKKLVAWLERAGSEEIYLLDNDSVYEPLLAYFEETSHTVVRLGQNYGRFALWHAPEAFALTRGRSFTYTDPDIVPTDECPFDAFERFGELLHRYPAVNKVVFGLKIDDLPDHYAHKDAVRVWEAQHWRLTVEPGAYLSAVDTSFALYRPNGQPRPADAIRTGPPYVARHAPWYFDLDDLPEDEAFYMARGLANHWNLRELPEWLTSAVDRLNSHRPSFLSRAILQARMYRRLHWTLRGRSINPRR